MTWLIHPMPHKFTVANFSYHLYTSRLGVGIGRIQKYFFLLYIFFLIVIWNTHFSLNYYFLQHLCRKFRKDDNFFNPFLAVYRFYIFYYWAVWNVPLLKNSSIYYKNNLCALIYVNNQIIVKIPVQLYYANIVKLKLQLTMSSTYIIDIIFVHTKWDLLPKFLY